MAIPLEMGITITSQGLQAFNTIQAGMAALGGQMQKLATVPFGEGMGLGGLAADLFEKAPGLAQNLGRAMSAMATMSQTAGATTVQNLEATANAFDKVRISLLSITPEYNKAILQEKSYSDAVASTDVSTQGAIARLEGYRDALLSSAEGLRQTSAEAAKLAAQEQATLMVTGQTMSAMDAMAASGDLTSQALAKLANSVARVKTELLKKTEAYARLAPLGASEKAMIDELSGAELRNISILQAWIETLRSKEAATLANEQAAARLAAQQEAAAAQQKTFQLAMGGVVSAMGTMTERGTLTSQAVMQLANSLERSKMEMLANTAAGQQMILTGASLDATIGALTGREAVYIKTLEQAEKALRVKANALKETEAALRQQQEATARSTDSMMVMSSITQGVMMGMGALQGSVMSVGFGLIFLRYAIAPIVLAVAALTAALGGIIKIVKGVVRSITSLNDTLGEFTFKMQQSGTVVASTAQMWDLAIGWAEKAARPIDEVTEALSALADAKLLREDIIGAMFEYATKKGLPLATVVGMLDEAIGGLERADPEALKKLGVAWEDIADTSKRSAVITAAASAMMKQSEGAVEDWAATIEGGMDRIRAAWLGVQDVFAEPIAEKILTPFVELLSKAATNIRAMAQEVWKSDAVQAEWNRTLKLGRDVMAWLTQAYKDNEELIRFFLEKALIGVLTIFRGLLWLGKNLTKSILMLAQAFGFLYRLTKPIRDALGGISQKLKELGFGPVLAAVKEFAIDFPGGILGGLLLAGLILSGSAALAIPLLLGALASRILLKLLNLDKETEEKWKSVFDWMFVLGLIGAFFGPLGMAIGAGLGFLIGLQMNFEDEWWGKWAGVFSTTAIGALAGAKFFGPVGALIGGFLGFVVGLFLNFESEIYGIFWDIGATVDKLAVAILTPILAIEDILDKFFMGKFPETMEESLRSHLESAKSSIEDYEDWVAAKKPPLPSFKAWIPDFDEWLRENWQLEGGAGGVGGGVVAAGVAAVPSVAPTATGRGAGVFDPIAIQETWSGIMEELQEGLEVPVSQGASPERWALSNGASTERWALPKSVSQPQVIINVTGNTILNEDDARRLADKINRATMGNLTNRFGMQLGRVG